MNKVKIIFVLFLIATFLLGLYWTVTRKVEGFGPTDKESSDESASGPSCPNLLIQRGNVLMMYDTNKPIVDGKNPIPFFNLDEYINYVEIQRSRGIKCPILFLQQENNTQGEDVYRMRPSPFDLQGGLPTMTTLYQEANPGSPVKVADASRDSGKYNKNNYPGFDPQGQYVGVYTEIDKVHDSTKSRKISDNPMDQNWAGVLYTQQMVDSGKYDENAVTKPVLFTPKTTFYPSIQNDFPPPQDII